MSETLNILLFEPSDAEARRLIDYLTSHGTGGNVTTVATAQQLSEILTNGTWDLALCAYAVPASDVRQILDVVLASDPDLPAIVLADEITEAESAALIVAGARDVMRKADLSRLAPIILREIESSRTRRELSQAAGRAEVRFRNIVEASLQGIMVRVNSKTRFVNSAFCKMFGYSFDELMNLRSMADLHPESERGRIKQHVRDRYAGDMSVYEYEIEGVRKDGSVFWCSKMASHVEWDGHRAVQIVIVDITERKKTEQQLAERERQYRETFENAPVALIRSGYDRKIVEVNEAFADMLGYARDEMIGLRVGDLTPAGDRERVISQVKQVWTRERARADIEHRLTRKDGREIWVQSSCHLTPDNTGHSIQMLAQFQEITGRREAEFALKERETLYRNLVEKSLQGLIILDHMGKAVFVNDVFADTIGYASGEIMAMEETFRLYHPDEQMKLRRRMGSRRTGDDTTSRYEIRAVKKDGTTIWLEQLTTAIEWNGQNAVQIAAIDITSRKMDAHLLEARELKYRQTFENAPIAMFRIDRNRQLHDVNRAFVDLVGYSADDLNGIAAYNLIHPDDAPNVRKRTMWVWNGRVERIENEYRMICKDGSQIWVSSSGRLTQDENGEFNHLIVQLQDITDRKEAEEQLRLAQQSLAVSEKQFRELFDNTPVGLCWVSVDGHYVRTNRAVQDMLGYTADEFLQMRPLDNVHPEHRESAKKGMMALRTGKTDKSKNETLHIRKDGREIWVSVQVNLLRDENGQPQHILAQLQDVTDRKRAEEQRDAALRSLAHNERQYRELFEHAPVAMSSVSLDGEFLQTNQAYRDMLGYSEEDIAELKPVDTVEASQREFVRATLESAGQRPAHGRVNHDVQLIRKDGLPIWVWISATVIRNDKDEPAYTLSHLQDITARKKAESQLFQSQKMEALGNLAGGIAHDFNNMLLPIIGLTALTKEDLPHDSPLQENLDTVIEAAENARRIVSQILTFSRQDQAAATPIAISPCIAEAVQLVRNILPSSITIIDEVKPDIGTVLADAAQLHSVILNLGSNASHAMEGKVGSLAIGLEQVTADSIMAESIHGLQSGAPYARIHVRDTGSGMDKETLDKIFNPFFTTKPVGEGTGLGLSMVHGIVERFGGGIQVSSELGVGTQFDIYLPLQGIGTSGRANADDGVMALTSF
jgi:PAS domain S-box-containing protein